MLAFGLIRFHPSAVDCTDTGLYSLDECNGTALGGRHAPEQYGWVDFALWAAAIFLIAWCAWAYIRSVLKDRRAKAERTTRTG